MIVEQDNRSIITRINIGLADILYGFIFGFVFTPNDLALSGLAG